MFARSFCLPLVALAIFVSAATHVWALGFQLSETKEQLKLNYEVTAQDHGTGRVTVVLTIADEGRLAPLDRGVDLVIPSQEGTGYVDLSLSLERKSVDGKQVVRVHLKRELAKRAEIQLKTNTLDGKQSPRTWYYHSIPLADHLPEGEPKQQ
ncbi:MAG: hypothetical protein WD872_18140 [Pirellulaceae bacterium]